jgi:F-type H+-transporting ATPase subunit b
VPALASRFPRHLLGLAFCVLVLGALTAPHAVAQVINDQERALLDPVTKWKVINSVLFAAALGWALWKYAPGFFNARSLDIQKAIKDATGLKIEADFRYSEIDKKMANLAAEKRRLEEQADAEMEREHQRILRETEAELEHIRRNAAAELDAVRAEGAQRVRQHTATLALELAEQRLRERFRAGEPGDLLQDFIHLVDRGKN